MRTFLLIFGFLLARSNTLIPMVETNTPEVLGSQSENVVTMTAVGDVMTGRSVNVASIKRDDFAWPFRETLSLTANADITVGNLETPIIDNCKPTDSGMVFCADKRTVEGLVFAGFDVLSLANNHSLNQGVDGLLETDHLLAEKGIKGLIEGEGVVVERKGKRFGFWSLDHVSHVVDEKKMAQSLLESDADVKVIIIHWGAEYTHTPHESQVRLGKAFIDAGADVVIGAHPHWTQPVERYGEGVIFYSLGNFVFDQMWSEETRMGEVAQIRFGFDGEKLTSIDYEMKPVKIFDYGQPRLDF